MKAEVRAAARKAHCRLCDGDIKIGDQMVTWYSHWNRGMHIHLHLNCTIDMGKLAEYEQSKTQTET